jgi:hypothetical protein
MDKQTWDEFQKDLNNKEPNNFICRKFGIKPHYLKWFKKYLKGEIKC